MRNNGDAFTVIPTGDGVEFTTPDIAFLLVDLIPLLGGLIFLGLQLGCTPQSTPQNMLKVGMTLEPPGLDPTMNAASATGEVVLYNVFETLTKIRPDGSVQPLLAES